MNRLLRSELLRMVAADQASRERVNRQLAGDDAFRREYTRRTDPSRSDIGIVAWETMPPVIAQMVETDRGHLPRLREVVRQHGWPGRRLVGEDGAAAFWLLVLHADRDRDFQQRCLALLSAAVGTGDADARQLAWLTDRLLLAQGHDQCYGTVIIMRSGVPTPFRLASPTSVGVRRSSVGLPPLGDDLDRIARDEPRRDFPGPRPHSAH
jgi:hypothetical protein